MKSETLMTATQITIGVLACAAIVGGMIYGAIEMDRSYERDIERCKLKGNIYDGWCKTKYQFCSGTVRDTFEDLTDTVGVSQNNMDTVSRTMSEEITRCLELNK